MFSEYFRLPVLLNNNYVLSLNTFIVFIIINCTYIHTYIHIININIRNKSYKFLQILIDLTNKMNTIYYSYSKYY